MEEKNRKTKPKTYAKESRDLVSVDPLSRYLQQVSQFPLLTEEEEKQLVEQVQKFRDIDAAKKLVTSHLRLVAKIATEYRSAYHNLLDLIQEGNIGLLKAVKSFNPEKGTRLAYYASWWIRSYILKYILDNFRLIKIGTTQAQRRLFFNLMREKEEIEKKGFTVENKLLADRLDVTEKEVAEMDQRLSFSELSIDAPVGEDGEAHFIDFLKDPAQGADEDLAHKQLKNVLDEKLKFFAEKLNQRELKIFHERLISEFPRTLQEIADEYGITRERVRQIEERIKEKLKKSFEESGFKVEENL